MRFVALDWVNFLLADIRGALGPYLIVYLVTRAHWSQATVGAVLTIISGVIHLYLWGETNGYREIATIGPLFLVQGISALIIGVATAALRWLIAVLAAAGLLAGTAAGLLITIEAGLFGFRESWGAPYARSSFYEEIAGAVLLLIAAWLLAVRKDGQH